MSRTDQLIAAVEAHTGKQGRRQGRNTRLICPAHDDHHPSLDIREAPDGSPLVICRACGAKLQEICAAIAHDWREYLPPKQDENTWTPTSGTLLETYDYTDENGTLLYQVCRTTTKEFPQRRPDPTAKHGWRWKLDNTRRVLYRLPNVLKAAAAGETIYICEGEKDVHAIETTGATATCNPGGAGKWNPTYNHHLAGANITIIADNDPPGIQHAHQIAASITASSNGHAPTVRIVTPKTGKDAHDHITAGHTLQELQPLEPPPVTERPLLAVTLEDFLQHDYQAPPALLGTNDDTLIPPGGLAIVAGMPGVGKTTLVIDLAFHLASATPWLDHPIQRPLNILLVENEGPEHKFQAKLRTKHQHWTHQRKGTIHIQTWQWGEFNFRHQDHQTMMLNYLEQHQIDIVIGDPLDTLGVEGVGSPQETREFVSLLVPLGLTQNRAFIFLHHFRKEAAANELNQVSGAWGGRLDTLLALKHADKDDELRLSYPKVRWGDQHPDRKPLILGKIKTTLGYEIVGRENPQEVDVNADEATLRQIISCLQRKGEWQVERSVIALSIGIPSDSGTFKRALKRGVDQDLLATQKAGKKTLYALTEKSIDIPT